MEKPILYRGQWPQNVNKTAKYAVSTKGGQWRVTVTVDLGDGLRVLAVEHGNTDIPEQVNAIKRTVDGREGGPFYVNEYHHLVVPVRSDNGSWYYSAGKVDPDFAFSFEGKELTSRPVDPDGNPLRPGDPWTGPRPGIPYVLAAGGRDIYFESPALTESDPPSVREGVTRRVQLSKVIRDKSKVSQAIQPVLEQRGHQGGRFYVNEHGAMFTPVGRGDGNGLDYIYCGQIDMDAWFPEPALA